MRVKVLTAASSLIALGAGLYQDAHHGLDLRSEERCKQVRDQAAKLMADNGIVEYLRDPPQGYLSESVDLIRGLDDIAAKLKEEKRGGYANELEFLANLRMLANVRPRDFHLGHWTPLLNLFDFPMSAQSVSISDNALAIPKIYLYTYVSPEPFALGLGDTTNVKCQNGTIFNFSNAARLLANFTRFASGADLYDVYGWGDVTDERPLNARFYQLAERNHIAAFTGYPRAFKSTRHVAGFLPEGSEFSDKAVLAVNSFSEAPHPDHVDQSMSVQQRNFYQVVVDFTSAAKAANRTKLVLDFQGNGGGLTSNIMALYFALFPGDTLPILSQARAHPQFAWLGKPVWDLTSFASQWPLYDFVRPDGKPWSSFKELYGPFLDAAAGHKRWGQHTHPAIINTTSVLRFSTDLFPLPDGWQYRQLWNTPPFRPEDIIIVSDGQCGSACALTVTMLTHAHGVLTVVLGGRPLRAPMQAVGQTRGGPSMSFMLMPDFNRSQVPEGLTLPPDKFTYRPPLRVGGSQGGDSWAMTVTFNSVDLLPYKGNTSDLGQGEVPLQFRYEAANCRLFYTWDMARDITAIWKAVAGVAWGGKKCAPGTTNADGMMGGVPTYSKVVDDQYRLGKGAGALDRK
ncbi:hypothetical protein N657DRAFT_684142 [Parathielavia appendiculata]|uniref:Tail specific protease domain-containing protein n=1 Tax=Parathielavia appendiculata TaxID=2587402 RepID=A0AAN6TTF2_9PEZI|nr:hypothetical protein N657DRAFT_684142 [Parathielavia appendiculata]